MKLATEKIVAEVEDGIGWLTFNHDTQRTGINLETQKMKDDTKKAMENGSELLKKAERSIDQSATTDDATPSK